ncbi:Tfp pilus assembly protein PilN [Caminicella sporogenes DSM 14501]|uniref:Tfp pilus assembly protein PilN n=1 Tax=Caminicella sporogenes DSM 14501 TaxID=1121266 RepID=A0A1M6LNP5_9FIRM|nr:PilN domain-containing protein [Caminicella sporogenes]RKD27896.1 hypothetical protein BET04_02210 [Caminicella sporogenes]SHJ72824.1 Tfp pilus assembly protein PilN [Caminicella sporogenes DSM 14501]
MRDINFFSQYTQKRRDVLKKYTSLTLVIIIIFSTSVGVFIYNYKKIKSLEARLDLLKEYLSSKDVKEKLNEYKNIEKKAEILNMYYSSLTRIIDRIDSTDNINSDVINDIKNVMPKKMFITSLNANSREIYLQGVTVNRILIAEFLHNLKNLGYFSNVNVNVISKEHSQTDNLVFTVKCYFRDVTEDEVE